MQSLMQQAKEIIALGEAMKLGEPMLPKSCVVCTAELPCWYHRTELLAKRKVTRAQWQMWQHRKRESAFQQAEQARDEENWQEQAGYAMPESVRISKGYAHD